MLVILKKNLKMMKFLNPRWQPILKLKNTDILCQIFLFLILKQRKYTESWFESYLLRYGAHREDSSQG